MRIPRLHKETSLYLEDAISDAIEDAEQAAQEALEAATRDIRYWTRFSDTEGLLVGEKDSSTNTQIRADRVDFNVAGVSQAHVGADGFVTERQITTPNVTMGSFAWIYDEGDDCLYLKRVV